MQPLNPTVSGLVRELFNCYDYFLKLSGFLFGKVFLINLKFSLLLAFSTFSGEQCRQNKFLRKLKQVLFIVLNRYSFYIAKLLKYLTL